MCGKWKRVCALGLAVSLVCLIPTGTMLAAEENAQKSQEAEQDSAAGNNAESGAGTISEGQNAGDGANIDDAEAGAENNTDNAKADVGVKTDDSQDGVGANADDPNAGGEITMGDDKNADLETSENDGIGVLAAAEEDAEIEDAENPESNEAPEIDIKWQGQSWMADGLGGKISYQYTNAYDQSFTLSVTQDGQVIPFSYYLDKFSDMDAEAKKTEQMNSLLWSGASPGTEVRPLNEGCYVLYVKVEADGEMYYARSGGIVVDRTSPEITGIEDGKSYSEGTTFQVKDANLESVMVNETSVTPVDGEYKVVANGTSCVIKALDKAGNEKVCSITVFGKEPEVKTISQDGTYTLTAGKSYQLGAGSWKVNGGSTVYQGGRTFYVKTDGEYRFTKR